MKHIHTICLAVAMAFSGTAKPADTNDSMRDTTRVAVAGKDLVVNYVYEIPKRNFTMWLIPTMHNFAKGPRRHNATERCRLIYKDGKVGQIQLLSRNTTIRHNRSVMTVLNAMMLPNFKSETLYGKHILSPFNDGNRRYYKYTTVKKSRRTNTVTFEPRFCENTLLVSGTAVIDSRTDEVISAEYSGEFDMIRFHVVYKPRTCKTDIDFRFAGNQVKSEVTIAKANNNAYIDYTGRNIIAAEDTMTVEEPDTTKKSTTLQSLENIGTSIGGHLLSSHSAQIMDINLKMSPVIAPHYLNYSHSRGLSYKMQFAADYPTGNNSTLSLLPILGYNFKIKQFYYEAPLRYTYNKEHDNYVELKWSNGNRIYNSSVIDDLKRVYGEYYIPKDNELDMFDNNKLSLVSHYNITKWLTTEVGLTYNRRSATDRHNMMKYAKKDVYQSFAPMFGVILKPWSKGPVLALSYEQGIKIKDFLDYGRTEGSASYSMSLPATQKLNLRVAGGFYSRKRSNIFMEYTNFSEDFLPGGWDDNWTNDFQLLDSRLYNISKYYVSGNVSYYTPIMFTTVIPLLNRYVERERFYLNTLLLERARPYYELGYGISTRVLSVGLFASFFNTEIQSVGAKFTFELFHRW